MPTRSRVRSRSAQPPLTSVTKAATLAAFAHQPTPADRRRPACSAARINRLRRRGHAADRPPTRPRAFPGSGSNRSNQQILIDGAGTFNRVEITLCWRTANDNAWRRHTLVTYVN